MASAKEDGAIISGCYGKTTKGKCEQHVIFYEYTYKAINQYFCSRNINIGMKKILFTISLTFLAGYTMAQETVSLGRCLQMGIERNLNLKTYEGCVLLKSSLIE